MGGDAEFRGMNPVLCSLFAHLIEYSSSMVLGRG